MYKNLLNENLGGDLNYIITNYIANAKDLPDSEKLDILKKVKLAYNFS